MSSSRKAGSVTATGKDEQFLPCRLDSWKSVARHFGRSCRTVQRWHTEFGLPIHRLGGRKSPIFAYVDELDHWMRSRGREVMEEPIPIGKPVLIPDLLAHNEPAHGNEACDSSLIPNSSKRRAADLVVQANKMWEALSCNNLPLIARHFREASDLDPSNAEAFAGLSHALIAEGLLGNLRPSTAYTAAEASLRRAMEIEPGLMEAKSAAAWLDMVFKRDWQGARRGLDEVLRDRPANTRALVGRGLLYIAEGALKEASGLLLQAAQQNALSSLALAVYGWCEYLSGAYANALLQIEQARACGHFGRVVDAVEALASIQLEDPEEQIDRIGALSQDSPQHEVLHGALGYAYGAAGRGQKAHEILESSMHLELHGKRLEPYAIALTLVGMNEGEQAIPWLEKSYREGSFWSLGFQSDPILAPLRNDPSYQQFSGKVSYPMPEIPGSRLSSAG